MPAQHTINDDQTVTVCNDHLTVTLPLADWEAEVARHGDGLLQILPSGDRRCEPPESVARGRILSAAAEILRYRDELADLPEQVSLDPSKLFESARQSLAFRWIESHSGYRDTLERVAFGHRLSTGQQAEWLKAQAWADGCLGNAASVRETAAACIQVAMSDSPENAEQVALRQRALVALAEHALTDEGRQALQDAIVSEISHWLSRRDYLRCRSTTRWDIAERAQAA